MITSAPPRTGIPPWSLAVTAMLLIQLANAWSVGPIAELGPAGTAWLRMGIGAVLLWLLVRPSLRRLGRRDVPVLLGLGLATGVMTVAFLSAIERIDLGTAVAIDFLGPLVVAAWARPSRRALAWPALAFIGVLLLTEPWAGTIDPVGVGYALLAGVCWGAYIVLTQRAGDRFSGVDALAYTIPVAALVTTVVGLPQVMMAEVTWQLLLIVAGLALMTPVVSFGLELLALRRMTRTAFGTLMAVEPGIAVVMGLAVLSQRPSAWQLLGIGLVVGAGIAAQRGGLRAPRHTPPDPPH